MASSGTGTGSPCGACKFLRRKCVLDCVFALYFSSDESPAKFAAMQKVFGASNVSKILLHVPVQERNEVVVTMAYEAEARLHDPVYGCVSQVQRSHHRALSNLWGTATRVVKSRPTCKRFKPTGWVSPGLLSKQEEISSELL